ncbi:putative G-protein coupled receptor AH9.4 [Ditylenchus destructor]|uniref:G-protein coupled receptor AH9.4 n=1 Tax=Ditylenchus destructor TaxID=166010 RepID=A0AAD4ND94_9BILA|nr:putative G-protein coupled receptor AH9.4 [Ditylenchus destructor]
MNSSHQSTSNDAQFTFLNESIPMDIADSAPGVSSPSTMRICYWMICVVGISLNLVVFRRNKYTRKRYNFNVKLLSFMAAADTISLSALMLGLSSQYVGLQDINAVALLCKLDLFLIHSASAFSIWCWLVLSAPYTHLRINKEPLQTILAIIVICCVLELWILYDVTFIWETRTCGETLPEDWGKRFQLFEIVWTYFLPLTLITVLDLKVLLFPPTMWISDQEKTYMVEGPIIVPPSVENCSPTQQTNSTYNLKNMLMLPNSEKNGSPLLLDHKLSNSSTATMTTPVSDSITRDRWAGNSVCSRYSSLRLRRRAQQMKMLKQCLLISILDLAMNLPNYLVRLYLVLISDEELDQLHNTTAFLWLQDISQLLYFGQFSLNALYLVAIIYVSPRRSSSSNSYASNGKPNHS